MINRDYKIFSPGNYYHIFNRGNGRQDVFLDDEDYRLFLFRLKENLFPSLQEGRPLAKRAYVRKTLPNNSFSLICYCLMPNHFHFIIKQLEDLPISKLIAKVCTGYSMCFNKKYEKIGNLFQSKFRAIKIESDPYLLWLSSYIHNNPKTAGLVKNLENYKYSSYLDYIGLREGMLCNRSLILGMFKDNRELYKSFIQDSSKKIKERKDLEHLFLD